MENLPSNWVSFASAAVVGIFVIINMFDVNLKKRRSEKDAVDEALIKALKETIDLHESEIKELRADFLAQKEMLNKLHTENTIMTKILQGRDEETKLFQKNTHDIVRATNSAIMDLSKMFQAFLNKQGITF